MCVGGGKKECASLGTLGFSVEACLTFFNILSCRWEGVLIYTSWGKILPTFKNLHESKSLNLVVIFIGFVVDKLGNKNNIKAINKRSLDLVLVRKANLKLDVFSS